MRAGQRFGATGRFVGAGLGLVMGGLMLSAMPAAAQAPECLEGRKLFEERQSIMGRINAWQKKKVDPNTACRTLTQLQGNGTRTIKWLEVNKDWCQVPEQAAEAINAQQSQVSASRANACKAAAEFNKAAAEARKQAQRAQQGGAPGFGGVDDFTGAPRPIPQGAL